MLNGALIGYLSLRCSSSWAIQIKRKENTKGYAIALSLSLSHLHGWSLAGGFLLWHNVGDGIWLLKIWIHGRALVFNKNNLRVAD